MVYTRRGFNSVADGEVAKKLSQDDQIDHFKKVPAFIDVCIDGLLDCLLRGFIEKVPRDSPGFTEEEAYQAMTFILC